MQTEIVPLAPALKYRVCWREIGSWDWQTKEFGTDRQAAKQFHRQKRNALRPAIIQTWSEVEQRWIG